MVSPAKQPEQNKIALESWNNVEDTKECAHTQHWGGGEEETDTAESIWTSGNGKWVQTSAHTSGSQMALGKVLQGEENYLLPCVTV